MEGFLDLHMLANVAVWEEETKSHQNQIPHSSSSSSLGQPKTPRLVFKFRGSDGQKTSFVFGNPPTPAVPHRKGLFHALVDVAVSALEDEEAKSHQSHKNYHCHWPLLTFCQKQRTTTLPRKPRRLLHQTTMTLSSSDEDEENDPSSVLLLPIKKRKWNKMSSPSEEEGEIKENNKKRKITCSRSRSRPRPLPPQDLSPIEHLPSGLRDKIRELGGDDLKLILDKKLTATDVNKNNNRLSILVSHGRCPEFLREDEKVELEKRDEKCEKRLKGIQVKVYDQSLREYHRCKLKQWYMGSNPVYNLDTKWYDIVLDNKLAKDDNVRLWSFRVQFELCFALAKLS
ncbi:B3 domain-containing protein [Trema orientale]|uniref:B3 domain-containing protein n=1 Tax=Trema orientale TaxID=63057 RepID=A0A2P5FBF3_TREOI|nr:B3 domain-containing protein [Trema orientale]